MVPQKTPIYSNFSSALNRPAAGRRAEGGNALEGYLKQIRQSLGRMTKAVNELGHVRRIVLTDYTGEMKMLDLHRSSRESDAPDEPTAVQSEAKSLP
jgi:hypothetical protein